MGTGNFDYTNRCVVVKDNDHYNFVFDEIAVHAPRPFNELRSYPRRVIESIGQATQVVLTSGYYSDCCIDFIQDTDKAMQYAYDEACCDDTEIQKEKAGWDLLMNEATEANQYIDELKARYELIEVHCVARASNGEAFYQEVKK